MIRKGKKSNISIWKLILVFGLGPVFQCSIVKSEIRKYLYRYVDICLTKGFHMNKDQQLFTTAINRLVFLSTNDEHGSTRSRGVETYAELAEELNNENILPKKGQWTESSVKQFLPRIKKKYGDEVVLQHCDIAFIGRSAWEYLSCTIEEEVREGKNSRKSVIDGYGNGKFYSYDLCGRIYNELEMWSIKGKEDPNSDYCKAIDDFKNNFEFSRRSLKS